MAARILLTTFLLLVALPALADDAQPSAASSEKDSSDFMTAAELAGACGNIGVKNLTPYQQHEATVALGYIWGVIAGADKRNSGNPDIFCAPPIDAYRACKTLNAWLAGHPDMLDNSAAHALLSSLRDTYPCGE